MYTNGMSIGGIAKVVKFSESAISKHIKKYGKKCLEIYNNRLLVLFSSLIFKTISFDELWTFVNHRKGKKRNSKWVWSAVCQVGVNIKKEFFILGDRSENTLRKFVEKLPKCLKSFSDDFKAYQSFFEDDENHTVGKNGFTNQNENLNTRMRHYLARLKRQSLSYSKSEEMLELSLAILFIEKNWI